MPSRVDPKIPLYKNSALVPDVSPVVEAPDVKPDQDPPIHSQTSLNGAASMGRTPDQEPPIHSQTSLNGAEPIDPMAQKNPKELEKEFQETADVLGKGRGDYKPAPVEEKGKVDLDTAAAMQIRKGSKL